MSSNAVPAKSQPQQETSLSEQKQAERAVLQAQKVHIRVQQRARKKNVTTVQGLDPRMNFHRICRELQTRWGCNGCVVETPDAGPVIQLQGNLSEKLKEFVLTEHMATEENLEIHSL